MDSHLKTLADASLAVTTAEEAIAEGAFTTATEELDTAAAGLAALREAWPGMAPPQRAVVARPAAGVRERIEAARGALPKRTALTVGTPVHDPEEEREPQD